MADKHADEDTRRTVLAAVGAMLAVAVVLGLVVAGTLLGAGRVLGVKGDVEQSSAPETLDVPPYTPTARPTPEPSEEPSEKPSQEPSGKPEPAITLTAGPARVAAGQRINLTGEYDGAKPGTTLQVQRREGGRWTDFPVTASVDGGAFQTWIQTSRTGRTQLRVLDRATGEASKAAVVTVG